MTDPKTSEYIKSFDFEARLAANVYRSMEDAKYTLWAMKDLFLIGWILGIDLDEEIIQLTKKKKSNNMEKAESVRANQVYH